MSYLAFGYSFRSKGGLNDMIGEFESIDLAKQAVEKAANSGAGAYWGEYHGHIATIENNKFVRLEDYEATVLGNTHAGKVSEQKWTVAQP